MNAEELKSAIINMLMEVNDVDALDKCYQVLYQRVYGVGQGNTNLPETEIDTNADGFPMTGGMFSFKMKDPKDKPSSF